MVLGRNRWFSIATSLTFQAQIADEIAENKCHAGGAAHQQRRFMAPGSRNDMPGHIRIGKIGSEFGIVSRWPLFPVRMTVAVGERSMIWDSDMRVQGSGFRVQGRGFFSEP